MAIKLISESDKEFLSECVENSQKRLTFILAKNLNESKLDSANLNKLHEEMLSEAIKLERFTILESISSKDFYEVQKNFRSLMKSCQILIKWFPGTALSSKIDYLSESGIELLSDLYDHIKDLEVGSNQESMGIKLDKSLSQKRDQFMKVYIDLTIVLRGMMAVADLFSEDTIGYNEIKGMFHALEQDGLSSEPLESAFQSYDGTTGKRNALPGTSTGIANDSKMGSFLSKYIKKDFLQQSKSIKKFQKIIAQTIMTASPGFNKIVPIQDVIELMLSRSVDQLKAYFQRFNDLIATDVDVNFLLQMSKNQHSVGSLFKGVWDALSNAGHQRQIQSI